MARARKPEKWGRYLDHMTDHLSVRDILDTGIGVKHKTVWRWRHRFLKAAVNDNTPVLSGVFETIEEYEVRGKTVPVLVDPSRSQVAGFLARYGALRASLLFDGSMLAFPANLALHGDIYDDSDQWPVLILGPSKVTYRIDSSFDGDMDELAQSAITEISEHQGLQRALGAGFEIESDYPG